MYLGYLEERQNQIGCKGSSGQKRGRGGLLRFLLNALADLASTQPACRMLGSKGHQPDCTVQEPSPLSGFVQLPELDRKN